MVSLSEEDISSLRVRLIAAHQKVEKQFETLYGKEAVLQTREIFEPYLKGITPLFESKERISEKQKKLDELGEIYRQKMTQLQGHLNETTDASSVKKETH